MGNGSTDASICEECLLLGVDVIHAEQVRDYGILGPKPSDLCALLDQYVIGQDAAKRIIAVAVYNHRKRLQVKPEGATELDKSNILLIGPTGSGKTFIMQMLARSLLVPLAIADATSLTEAGYVGDDVENIIGKLFRQSDFNVEKTQQGIVYIDEIDKIARKTDNTRRDVGGEGVQQALLKLIEGTTVTLPNKSNVRNSRNIPEFVEIDTKNILFVCGGAFDGLDRVIHARTTRSSIGFGAELRGPASTSKEALFGLAEPEDLIQFGMIPEIVGRLPVIARCEESSVLGLVDILTKPKNSLLRQFRKLFDMDGAELDVSPEALLAIAEKAFARKLGARGLRSILEELFLDAQFELPSLPRGEKYKIVLTEDAVLSGHGAIIESVPVLKSVSAL